jgi:hypothetical protein
MASSSIAQELRELLALAIKLRAFAHSTNDPADVALFQDAAAALESRADHLAYGTPSHSVRDSPKVDFVC